MYAVIRAGGKQYRVAPGDVIRIEKVAPEKNGVVEFAEVLAVSGSEGSISRPQSEARVVGQVLGEGRGDKVLVFHYKRKKQYKKLRGHRQPFSAVRITEISFDGEKFTAPPLEAPTGRSGPRAAEGGAAPPAAVAPAGRKGRRKAGSESKAAPGAGSHTAAKQYAGTSKATGSKTKGGKPPAPKKKK